MIDILNSTHTKITMKMSIPGPKLNIHKNLVVLGENSPQYFDKKMPGNIGELFVKCMRQVIKGHLYNLSEISDYYVIYRQRAQSAL